MPVPASRFFLVGFVTWYCLRAPLMQQTEIIEWHFCEGTKTHSNKVRRLKSYLSKLRSGFFNIYASEDRMNTFTILSTRGFFPRLFFFKGFLLDFGCEVIYRLSGCCFFLSFFYSFLNEYMRINRGKNW